jgi:SAM-dependent methyltransferase
MPSWDDSAPQYDAFEKKWHHYEKIARGLIDRLRLYDTSKVLELASGTGACTRVVAKFTTKGKIIGIDQSEKMLELAKENMIKSGIANVSFFRGTCQSLRIFSMRIGSTSRFATLPFGNLMIRKKFWMIFELCSKMAVNSASTFPDGFLLKKLEIYFEGGSMRYLRSTDFHQKKVHFGIRQLTTRRS